MSFDDDLFYFKARQIVERNWNNLINFCFDHRNELALFLKLHFHNINEIKEKIKLIEHWFVFHWIFLEFLLFFQLIDIDLCFYSLF